MSSVENNEKPDYDTVLQKIATYVVSKVSFDKAIYETAAYDLMDTMGCGILALSFPQCVKLLGPVVPGATLKDGVKIPGTTYELEPVQAAFNIGTMIRWLDFNDTWLAAEWGHPSDNLGAILAVAAYVNKINISQGKEALTMQIVLEAMIKAHEIQGVLALENSFNRVGLDHVFLVKLASAAVAAWLLGANYETILNTLSQVCVDGQSLRTYRHAPNTGSRKSWAAGDASARAVRLALISLTGEMGYPSALTAHKWGFYDVLFEGKPFKFQREFGSYVMDHVLFKISYPAEFHAQTAVECAVKLHSLVKDRLEQIESIELTTHESAIRIISKQGALHNPADRDHCLQYMVAIGLIYGSLKAEHYEDNIAANPQIDILRSKMQVIENKDFSKDYLDPEKRSIANAIQIKFKNGSVTDKITVEYPLGHKKRRAEGLPLLLEKFQNNMLTKYSNEKTKNIMDTMLNLEKLMTMNVDSWLNLFVE